MTKHTQRLISSCCGGSVHHGAFLAGCADNWICDTCGRMCHGINPEAVAEMLEALEAMNAACNMADVRERDRLTAAAIPAARAALTKAHETH
ncbi:MAG: hypothetical protein WC565_10665 [Parcubacteria group bacterium]